MAYTSAPETQTYGTQRIPAVYDLDIPPGATTGTAGSGMINIVPVKVGENIWGETRYALRVDPVVTSTAGADVCRGMYVWEKTAGTIYYFVVLDNGTDSKVYSSTDASTWTSVNTLTTHATTPVRFTEFIDDVNTKKLVMVDGIEGYVFTSNAAGTKITDVDFPTPHIPFPVFLDGYLFLAKSGTGDIYNSDLNDPAIWTAGSYISSEIYPDDLQALVKINNYILAVGTDGCEYFYDAANATASPLARVEGQSLAFGTPFPNTIAYNKEQVILLANNNDGEVSLQIISGFQNVEVPCPFVSLLNTALNGRAFTGVEKLRGYLFRHKGQLCYALCFNGMDTGTINVSVDTFIYSFNTKLWFQFNIDAATGSTKFPVGFTAPTTTDNLLTYVAGHSRTGTVFFGTLRPTTTVDTPTSGSTGVIPQTIRTDIQDFGTLNLKFMSRAGLLYTSTSYSGLAADAIQLNWNDAGNTSSGGGGSNGGSVLIPKTFTSPFIYQLGSFRQRRFVLTTSGSAPIVYKAIEVDINKGQQ